MKTPWLERHHLAGFLVLVALGVGLTTIGVSAPDRVAVLQRSGLALTSPLARLGTGLVELCGDAWRGVAGLRSAHAELEALRRENHDLRLLLDQRRELALQNDRFRELLSLEPAPGFRAVPAEIIHQELSPDRVLVLNRGSRQGLRADLAVVVPGGVVGKVISVTSRAAKVQCLTDPNAGVAVLVGRDRVQVDAVVKDAAAGLLRLRHFELLAPIAPGDPVVTSGLDQVHPKGLFVGRVERVSEIGGGEREVLVRPAVDFGRLEEVIVLVPEEAREPLSLAADRRVGS